MTMFSFRPCSLGRVALLSYLFVTAEAIAQKSEPPQINPQKLTTEERLKRIESIVEPFQGQSFLVDPPATWVATGFVAAEGAAAASGYVTAYRTAGNCVFWYETLSPDAVIQAQWKGPPCKGQLVSGEGGLRVTVTKTEDGKSFIVQHEMMGKFINGYLAGEGVKSNVLFNLDRLPTGEAYVLTGNFAYSTLSGAGTRYAKFPKGPGASAVAYAGNFVNGQPHGLIERLSMGHGEGVKGDIFFLLFNNGSPLINQSRLAKEVEGYIHTAKGEWKVAVVEWRDGRPRGADISWRGNDERPYTIASCGQWQIEGSLWKCASGSFVLRENKSENTLGVEARAFSISTTTSRPLRLAAPGPVLVKDDRSANFNHPLSCDVEIISCSGKANVSLGSEFSADYWSGDVMYRAGFFTPVGRGRFMQMPAETSEAIMNSKRMPSDRVLAECDRLASPVDCAKGSLTGSKATYSGAYRLSGTAFGAEQSGYAPRYYRGNESESERGWMRYGTGSIDYGNGLVAQVRFRNNILVGVDDCSWPEKGDGSCTFSGNAVTFRPDREAVRERPRRESSSSSRPYPDTPVPGRYEPIAVPQRPTYVLPGMR